MTDDDATLLLRYARDGSNAAFAELVQRHLNFVYSAALRQTGDVHKASDVAQLVFIAAARNASSLARHPLLPGWLYTATRNAAFNLMRADRRRQLREQKAYTMQEFSSPSVAKAHWERLQPVLDEAMNELDGPGREAVLLRF